LRSNYGDIPAGWPWQWQQRVQQEASPVGHAPLPREAGTLPQPRDQKLEDASQSRPTSLKDCWWVSRRTLLVFFCRLAAARPRWHCTDCFESWGPNGDD
jgi:hypothetical protein